MYTKQHIILGAAFSLLLFIIYPQINQIGLSLIFLSSVLIDVDHYLYHLFTKKDWSLKNAYKWFVKGDKKMKSMPREKREGYYTGFCLFHGIEVLIILIILSEFVSSYFFFIFIGISFHLILDIVDEAKCQKRIDKFSIIYDYFKFKKLKLLKTSKAL